MTDPTNGSTPTTSAGEARYQPFNPRWSWLARFLFLAIFYAFSFAIEHKDPLGPVEWTQWLADNITRFPRMAQVFDNLNSPIFNLLQPRIFIHVAGPFFVAHILANATINGLYCHLYGFVSRRKAGNFLQQLIKETKSWRPYRSRKFFVTIFAIAAGATSYFGLLFIFVIFGDYILTQENLPGNYFKFLILAFWVLWIVLTVTAIVLVKESFGGFDEHYYQAGWKFLLPYATIIIIMFVIPLIFIQTISLRLETGDLTINMAFNGFRLTFFIIFICTVIAILLSPNQPKIYEITPDNFDEKRSEHTRLHPPGPIRVWMLEGHHVATTEYNGRFHRVLRPGRYNLQPFEYIYSVLDLRQQVSEDESEYITRDGIEVSFKVGLTTRIATSRFLLDHDSSDSTVSLASSLSTRPTERMLFPYSKQAVRKAAYTRTSLDSRGVRVNTWTNLPLLLAQGRLRFLILEMSYNDLFNDRENEPGHHMHEWLAEQVKVNTQNVLNSIGTGIHVIELRLGAVQAAHSGIIDGRVKTWRSGWELRNKLRHIEIEGEIITERAETRQENERLFIETMVNTIREAEQIYGSNLTRRIVALRIVQTLDRMTRLSPHFENQAAWELFRQIRNLQDGSNQRGSEPMEGEPTGPSISS